MKLKRTLSLLLCLVLVLGLFSGCGGGTSPTTEPDESPEQLSAQERGEPRPNDEYERGIWYGFIPEELLDSNPYETIVTWKQFCVMLENMMMCYDESNVSAWQELTSKAPDMEMKRDGAMIALTFAAEEMGLLEQNIRDDLFTFLYLGPEWEESIFGYDWGSNCSHDYPIFPWDEQCPFSFDGCSTDSYIDPAYFYCTQRVSSVSGMQLINEIDGDFRLNQPLTLEDALLMVVRLYESDYDIAAEVCAAMQEAEQTDEAKAVLAEADALREDILNNKSIPEIIGTTYYVSNHGSDSNDGLTPETAWETITRVTAADLRPGDGVLFERGSLFRGEMLECQEGVTYSAYGEGAKPIITGSPENGAAPEKWTLFGETSDGSKVWLYYKDMPDCGSILFDEGRHITQKVFPRWAGSYVNADGSKFDVMDGLDRDLAFFTPADSLLVHAEGGDGGHMGGGIANIALYDEKYNGSSGKLYLRCDAGNPGEVYNSIEFAVSPGGVGTGLVYLNSGVIFDNIKVCCTSDCGLFGGGGEEMRYLQNCEISYCGGNVIYYEEDGTPVHGGDGINTQQFGITIKNCYFHDNSDNAITAEWEALEGDPFLEMGPLTVSGNLFERNNFDVQMVCFNENMKGSGVIFKDFLIENNYMMSCNSGWSAPMRGYIGSCIRYGDIDAPMYGENMVIRNNVMYSAEARSILYGGNIGFNPPLFENNRIFVPRRTMVTDREDNVMVALWANPEGNPEFGTDFLRLYDHNSEQFLNNYLGSCNMIEFIR